MSDKIKKLVISIGGGFCLLIGAIFIILPGPAVIFLPVGLAILSLEYAWAKVWLKKAQRCLRNSAVKTDDVLGYWKRRYLKK